MRNYLHICNKGCRVIFRDKQDYVYFINKFAIATTLNKIQVLAITVMSTHFHSIVIDADVSIIDNVIFRLKKTYAIYYKNKYGDRLSNAIQTSYREFHGSQNIENEMLYVLRNPMHHYVMSSPFTYPFSNASSLFKESLTTEDFGNWGKLSYRKANQLNYREYRKIFGNDIAQINYEIDPNGMITFESFINNKIARSFWKGYKQYLWDMLSNVKNVQSQIIDQDNLDTQADTMSDIDVCQLIDNQASSWNLKSFHYFNQEQLDYIIRLLNKRNVNQQQIDRCLWINESK